VATKLVDPLLREFYDDNIEKFEMGETVNASHILVKTEEEAKEVRKELLDGADFSDLAKEKSIDPSAQVNYGNLGFFPKGAMVPEFEKVAFSLQEGKISQPVKSAFGWHIIKVQDRSDARTMPFEDIKGQLIVQILPQYLESKRDDYNVEIHYAGMKQQELSFE